MIEAASLSPEQRSFLEMPSSGSLILEGPAGTGKTTTAIFHYRQLLENGIPSDEILLLAPQRTLLQPYLNFYQQLGLPSASTPAAMTMGGMARRLIALFWPLISRQAGFTTPYLPPTFLTLETSQYYMAHIVRPLLDRGYFSSITMDRNRLYSQLIDNLNKAAVAGFAYTQIAERLKSSLIKDPSLNLAYDQVQECAGYFRAYCLEHNLLDFSLQVEIFTNLLWPSLLSRSYLIESFPYLIYDNLEEDPPVFQDIIRSWLPHFKSAWLIRDSNGGFRTFLGADPENGATLAEACDSHGLLDHSWTLPPSVFAFRESLLNQLSHSSSHLPDRRLAGGIRLLSRNFYPEMVEAVCQEIFSLVAERQADFGDIAVLAPYISDSLRFSIMKRLEQLEIPAQSHRPSRSLKDEPATDCLLTLAKLSHPSWKLPCSQSEIRQALMTAIEDLDLIRADLLSRICFKPNRWEESLSSFDLIQPEMQSRIGYWNGERFERLRAWLENYRRQEPQELDVFISRIFGEVLSQPGFGFHTNFDAAAVAARLVESVQKFRMVVGQTLSSDNPVGKEYLQMVADGVVAAQYLQSWEPDNHQAVLVAPAYTYLMTNRITPYQFWLDIGSTGWAERLFQPLTHPVVLSRRWKPGSVWTDVDEQRYGLDSLSRLADGLLSRCTGRVYLCISRINQQGDETRGKLLTAVQSILRHLPDHTEVEIV